MRRRCGSGQRERLHAKIPGFRSAPVHISFCLQEVLRACAVLDFDTPPHFPTNISIKVDHLTP
jgi:hypothetical protein